jgi:hypothetical protein
MIELRIAGGTLNLLPDTTITIEEKNPAYLGENVDVLVGEYSYPFTLPLDAHNRALLGYPDRLDGNTRLARSIPAQLHLAGNLRIDGKLFLEEPTRKSVKVFIASNSLIEVKDKALNEITTRSYELGNDNAAILAHLTTVSQSPLDYDYTAFPFYNKTLASDEEVTGEWDAVRYHNAWLPGSSSFTADGPVSIFPRLQVVLTDLMAQTGYDFQNAWQTDDQLRRLALVNNRDLKDENGDIATEVDLPSLLSEQKAGEFVRHLCRLFCLAPFLDIRARSITLQPLRDLITRDTQRDWTSYAGREYSYTQGQAALLRMAYPSDAYNEAPSERWRSGLDQSTYLSDSGAVLPGGSPLGRYYDYPTGESFELGEVNSGLGTLIRRTNQYGYHFGAIDNEDGTETNAPEILPIATAIYAEVPASSGNSWMMPAWYTSAREQGSTPDQRLAFHWGNAESSAGSVYPFGSWNNYTRNRTLYPGSLYSLGWEGPYGLYEKWWKNWDQMLRDGKLVTRNFLLPPDELHNFTFDQKVRVDNKDYFVQSLRYQVTLRGISEVRAVMLSVF